MTNFEFYKDEILKVIGETNSFALKDNELVNCNDIKCSQCKFAYSGDACVNKMIKWLYDEYKSLKLTKKEKSFCEVIGSGWLARDQDDELYLYGEKPRRGSHIWNVNLKELKINSKEWKISHLKDCFYPKFSFIKWEDEPYNIKEMLTWEVIE